MKFVLFFSFCLFFACSCQKDSESNQNLPDFPAYSENMLKEKTSCGVSSIFGNCYAECENRQDCNCENFYIDCNCSCSNNDGKSIKEPSSVISVTPIQYENWKKFANKIKSLESPQSKKAYRILVQMFESIKKNDMFAYQDKYKDFISNLKKLPNTEKQSLNIFLKELSENNFQIP